MTTLLRGRAVCVFVVCIALLAHISGAFYLPGVAPKEYANGEKVDLKVNKMVSAVTQLPYDFYSLPFCREDKGPKLFAESLGEILMGDKIESSPYQILAGVSEVCKVLCKLDYTSKDLAAFEERVRQEYRVNWILDNLPAAVKKTLIDVNGMRSTIYELGFPLGVVENDVAYLHNHVHLKIIYHTSPEYEGRRIVGFEVEPQSIQHGAFDVNNPSSYPESCVKPTNWQAVSGHTDAASITFTYSVEWELNPDIKWSSRWDVYLKMTDTQIHWFSIVNSLMIVLFLTGMVALIMRRTIHADVRRYIEMEQEDAQEETGWKLVHADVFRPPNNRMILSVLVGSGVQVFSMTVITLIFALLGFLSPANRGGLMTAVLVLYILMGLFAGYFSARVYKAMRGTSWKANTILTAVSFPGFAFVIFFILNVFLGAEHSTGYVHLGILIGIFTMWIGISLPLTFFGSYLGFKKPPPEIPVKVNQIPRQTPELVWYMRPVVSVLMGGILPFGAVFIELFFILSSIWQHQFYYMFGFLFLVFVILIITCAEITIVMCYFQLCSEDYHWWWRSYLTPGASALYMFLYSIFYFMTKLHITSFVSAILYFGYTLIMALAFFVLTGSIGFYSCYFFVLKIYASVKVA
eukprot:TRINITY_DN4044_c0_g1_i1.p1 TRINITY_DN4044_c0_g1~~TRINITY_DN4044_c0_g1_i1.p1  ORF type:complete len:653 (-),score=306.02 TRINITY_DN4044_c0_g1_i1:177-2075(-)